MYRDAVVAAAAAAAAAAMLTLTSFSHQSTPASVHVRRRLTVINYYLQTKQQLDLVRDYRSALRVSFRPHIKHYFAYRIVRNQLYNSEHDQYPSLNTVVSKDTHSSINLQFCTNNILETWKDHFLTDLTNTGGRARRFRRDLGAIARATFIANNNSWKATATEMILQAREATETK